MRRVAEDQRLAAHHAAREPLKLRPDDGALLRQLDEPFVPFLVFRANRDGPSKTTVMLNAGAWIVSYSGCRTAASRRMAATAGSSGGSKPASAASAACSLQSAIASS